jgi:hypothetical protein
VLLIVKLLSPNVRPSVRSPSVIGNVINPTAPNQNASWFVRTQIVFQKLNAVHVLWEVLEFLLDSHSLKKQNKIKNAVHARNKIENEMDLIKFKEILSLKI